MTTNKLYNLYQLNERGYELNNFDEKEDVFECLKKSIPQEVKFINV